MHLSSVVERVSVLIPVVVPKELSIVVKRAWLMFHWHCLRILPKCKNSHLSSCHYRMHIFYRFFLFFITTNNKKHTQTLRAELHHGNPSESICQPSSLTTHRSLQQQHFPYRLRCFFRIKISQLPCAVWQQNKGAASRSLQGIIVIAIVVAKCQRDLVHSQGLI